MGKIYTDIQINATPEKVREVFLDFAHLSEWHKELKIVAPEGIEVGARLQCEAGGFKFSPVVLVNTNEEFMWRGEWAGIFTGEHCFQFQASGNGTRFVQTEHFWGLLSFAMGPWFWGDSTKNDFEKLNEHLKSKVESGL